MSDFSDCCYCESTSYPYFAEWRIVRKKRKCYECRWSIQPGAKAYYTRGKCEGEWWSGYTCERCQALADHITAHVPCFCYEHGNMWGQLSGDPVTESQLAECARKVSREVPGFYFGVLRRIVSIEQGRA